MAIEFSGRLFDNEGDAIASATVEIFTRDSASSSGGTAEASTTTDSSGDWSISEGTQGMYDVRITSGSSVRWRKYDDAQQFETLEVANFRLRNPANSFEYDIVPAGIGETFSLTLPLITDNDTLPAIGLPQTWSAIQTHSADIIIQDASDLALGTGSDVLLRWSTADSSNHAAVLALGDSNEVLHVTNVSDVATDWNVSANAADAEVWIHSDTTPATDYMRVGGHDGTTSYIDVVGGTTLALAIAGTTEVNITANGIEAENAAGPAFVNEAAMTTNPTLIPDKAELDTGIGWASDTLHFVLGGATHANLSTTVFTVSGDVSVGDDLLFASGAVANWNSGDITLTHSAGTLTYGGDGAVVIAHGANVDLSFTGTTGTNDIVLTNALADALSITDGSADIVVIDTSTSGNVTTFTSAITVGVNDTGHDVKFFGATAGQYLLWDESTDELVLAGDTKLSFHDAAGGENIIASANGHLEVNAGTTLDVTAPTVDINASTAFTVDTAGISLDSSGASNLTTSGGALTLTSAAAATWSTAAGALTVNGTNGVNIQEGGSTIIGISDSRVLATTNTASVDLDASGAIQVNSSGGAISVANDNVDQTVNLATAGTRTLNIGINDGTDVTTVVSKGNVTQTGTFTVGVNDTGHDVKFFGAADGAYLLWDESEDKLLTAGGAVVDIVKDKLLIGGTAVTTTAAELNVLDAVTAGTVTASLGVVVDSDKDIGSFRNVTAAGDITAAGIHVTGDTAAGDNAALGYTAAEGLILTGQGSTNDITLKNDADGDVMTVATGATGVEFPGVLTATGGIADVAGVAGNDWTASLIRVQNSSAGSVQVIIENTNTGGGADAALTIKSAASAADPTIYLQEGGGNEWRIFLDQNVGDVFKIGTAGSTSNNAIRITQATPPVVTYNSTHPTGVFDYICDGCGRHEAERFECCGPVEWHDDVMDFRALTLNKPGALDYMVKVGVMEQDTPEEGGDVFTVLGRDFEFALSAAFQNRQRMDDQYAELDRRLKALGV